MGWTALKLAAGTLPLAIAAAAQGVAAAAPAPLPTTNTTTSGNVHGRHDALRHGIDGTHHANDTLNRVPDGMRVLPDPGYLAPIIPAQLHLPAAVAPVAPIEAPPGTIRAGDLVMGAPGFLSPVQVAQVNRASANAEAQIATFGDSIGLDQTRSDRLGSAVIGDTLIGAGVGWSTLGLPMAAAGGLVGGLTGIIVGFPFLPIGLLIGPIVSAAIGAGATAAPFVLAGAAAGAGVGVAQAVFTPPHGQPTAAMPPAPMVPGGHTAPWHSAPTGRDGHTVTQTSGRHHWAATGPANARA